QDQRNAENLLSEAATSLDQYDWAYRRNSVQGDQCRQSIVARIRRCALDGLPPSANQGLSGSQGRKRHAGAMTGALMRERKSKDSNGRPGSDANGEPRMEKVRLERPQVFIAYVFNAEQIDGVPSASFRECSWNPLGKAEQLQSANSAMMIVLP